MFNLQGSEIIFILLIALVVLGPEKLPGAIRRMTSLYTELRKMSSGFQDEFKSVLDEPLREMKSTADLMKSAADPKQIAEEAEREAELEAEADKKARQARETTAAMEAAGAAHLAERRHTDRRGRSGGGCVRRSGRRRNRVRRRVATEPAAVLGRSGRGGGRGHR